MIFTQAQFCFNSKLVRLEVSLFLADTVLELGFNSILVRLEVEKLIKAGRNFKGFNSILVRLEVSCERAVYGSSDVSIPYWFD